MEICSVKRHFVKGNVHDNVLIGADLDGGPNDELSQLPEHITLFAASERYRIAEDGTRWAIHDKKWMINISFSQAQGLADRLAMCGIFPNVKPLRQRQTRDEQGQTDIDPQTFCYDSTKSKP